MIDQFDKPAVFFQFLKFFPLRLLSQKLDELKDKIQGALVDRVVEDFVDITTPLKQFTDAVLAPEGTTYHTLLFKLFTFIIT